MPAPGDPAVLLHRLGTAQCEAILPRGMHPAQRPQLQQGQEPQVTGSGQGAKTRLPGARETRD